MEESSQYNCLFDTGSSLRTTPGPGAMLDLCGKPLICPHRCKKPKNHPEACGGGNCPYVRLYTRSCGHKICSDCKFYDEARLPLCEHECKRKQKCGHYCERPCFCCDQNCFKVICDACQAAKERDQAESKSRVPNMNANPGPSTCLPDNERPLRRSKNSARLPQFDLVFERFAKRVRTNSSSNETGLELELEERERMKRHQAAKDLQEMADFQLACQIARLESQQLNTKEDGKLENLPCEAPMCVDEDDEFEDYEACVHDYESSVENLEEVADEPRVEGPGKFRFVERDGSNDDEPTILFVPSPVKGGRRGQTEAAGAPGEHDDSCTEHSSECEPSSSSKSSSTATTECCSEFGAYSEESDSMFEPQPEDDDQ